MKKLIPAAAWAILMLCGTVVADDLARYDTFKVGDSAYSYPFDFADYPKGVLAENCIEYATMDLVGATKPGGTPAESQWSAVGFNDGGSFVYTVQSRERCPLDPNMNACFDPELLYAGGIKRSSTGPTLCDVTLRWIDCGDTEVQSAVIDSFAVTESYRNNVYDLDVEVPGLGCDELGCVEWLQVEWHATGGSTAAGTFRIGNYYDGAYYNFGVTGTCCCKPVPEPSMVAFGLTGVLGLVAVASRRRRK